MNQELGMPRFALTFFRLLCGRSSTEAQSIAAGLSQLSCSSAYQLRTMPASLTSIALLLAGASALLIIWRHWKERSSGVRSLPGPPGRFLVGNLFDVPPKDSHLKYTDWSKLYGTLPRPFSPSGSGLPGPIFEINVFNRTVVVISAHSVAMDLLEKRGSIYSDRPALHMHDL